MATAQDLMNLFGVGAPALVRVGSAFGRYWNLRDGNGDPRSATVDEVVAFMRRQIAAIVRNAERAEQEAQINIAEWE